ncbi:YgaP family membrane protein [Kaarinaea lacus]
MEKSIMDFNLGFYEKCNRVLVGSALLMLAMLTDEIPTLFALAALYPLLTAIVAWDPLYAVMSSFGKWFAARLNIKTAKPVLS